jgi:hypothetical protein
MYVHIHVIQINSCFCEILSHFKGVCIHRHIHACMNTCMYDDYLHTHTQITYIPTHTETYTYGLCRLSSFPMHICIMHMHAYIETYIWKFEHSRRICLDYLHTHRERERDTHRHTYAYIHTYIHTRARTHTHTDSPLQCNNASTHPKFRALSTGQTSSGQCGQSRSDQFGCYSGS